MGRAKLVALLAVSTVLGGIASGAVVVWLASRTTLVLRLDHDVPVLLRGKIPFRAAIDQRVDVGIVEGLHANVSLGRLSVPLDTAFEVPLDFTLDVPLDNEINVADSLELDTKVAIDTVLTEHEIDLSQLQIPIDTDVYVDDSIAVETTVPVDSEVTTLLGVTVPVHMKVPIKTKIPIHQKVHVRDVIQLKTQHARIPLHMTLPVHAKVPLARALHVRGNVRVPVKQRVRVPVKQLLALDLVGPLPVTVALQGKLPAQLKADLDTSVTLDQAIPARLGRIEIKAANLSLERDPRPAR